MCDALTGRRVAGSLHGHVVAESAGCTMWGGIASSGRGGLFVSACPGAEGRMLDLQGSGEMAPKQFRYGIVTVDEGHSRYRVLRMDSDGRARDATEPEHKVVQGRVCCVCLCDVI